MRTVKFRYPEDPVLEAVIQTGQEFLRAATADGPRMTTVLAMETGDVLAAWPMGDEICCDLCSDEVGLADQCAVAHRRLYCWKCYQEWIEPYIIEEKPHAKGR